VQKFSFLKFYCKRSFLPRAFFAAGPAWSDSGPGGFPLKSRPLHKPISDDSAQRLNQPLKAVKI
jgi:hypothetical protein